MRVLPRNDDDTKSISYVLLNSKNIVVEFKIKLYDDKNGYFHSEVIYPDNKTGISSRSAKLNPASYIQITKQGDPSEQKKIFYLFENHKNRIVRDLSKLYAILDAYDSGGIDIISVGKNGNYINENVPYVLVHCGKVKCSFRAMIDDNNTVFIQSEFGEIKTDITINEFLDLYIKLKTIDYSPFSMQLLSYYERPDKGYNEYKITKNAGINPNKLIW